MSERESERITGAIVVPPQLRWAEALDQRAQEVIEGVLSDESTMAQIRDGIAELERGEPPVPWREIRAQAQARAAPNGV
jgi:hypothetical protein